MSSCETEAQSATLLQTAGLNGGRARIPYVVGRSSGLCDSIIWSRSNYNNIDMLTQVKLKQVAGIIQILGPLAEATNDISGDTYPTSSLVIPILHCLKTHLVNYIAAKEDAITITQSTRVAKI
ncbi:hypothetical protein PR048_025476 [Dryococelus australis]|uniref:Uncharacterized protein n=1 Tax=Dryococelus australis TaxID=614101 RepID=A0ABQ9GRF7_9NEOP|nr:hypothetical protein PR048_025476 [Dryococelus australis]